jgi:hypothetical protein
MDQAIDKPDGKDEPVRSDQPQTKFFGGEYAGAIFRLSTGLIGALFLVPIIYIVQLAFPENPLELNTKFFLFLFLLFLSVALFLSLMAGERYNVKIAGITFAGSMGALAGLLFLFGYFNDSIVGRRPPEFATLAFDCDFAEKNGQKLVMFVTGDEEYVSLLEHKVNIGKQKPFIRVGNSQIQPYSEHNLLLMNPGDKKFSIPVDFNLQHTLEIVPVPPAIANQLRNSAPTSQPDANIEKTSSRPLLIVKMDMMRRDKDAPRITALFDLNVASSYCNPEKETVQAAINPQGSPE